MLLSDGKHGLKLSDVLDLNYHVVTRFDEGLNLDSFKASLVFTRPDILG